MRAFLTFVVLIASCLLQAIATKYISFANIRFEFVIIAVVFYSLKMDLLPAAMVGVAGGLIKDALSSGTFGVSAMAFLTLALVLSWNRRLLSSGSATTQAILVTLSIVLCYAISGLIETLHGASPFPFSFVLRHMAPVLIANALIAPLCFKIMRFIDYEMA